MRSVPLPGHSSLKYLKRGIGLQYEIELSSVTPVRCKKKALLVAVGAQIVTGEYEFLCPSPEIRKKLCLNIICPHFVPRTPGAFRFLHDWHLEWFDLSVLCVLAWQENVNAK